MPLQSNLPLSSEMLNVATAPPVKKSWLPLKRFACVIVLPPDSNACNEMRYTGCGPFVEPFSLSITRSRASALNNEMIGAPVVPAAGVVAAAAWVGGVGGVGGAPGAAVVGGACVVAVPLKSEPSNVSTTVLAAVTSAVNSAIVLLFFADPRLRTEDHSEARHPRYRAHRARSPNS